VIDRTFEKAYILIFKALKETNQETELKKSFQECKKVFRKELGIEPPKSLQDFLNKSA
jgi:DNA-binding SARP family transcriptional activator